MTETIAAFWLLASLLVTFAGFSLASIAYQAWGAELAKKEGERARITGIREGFGLAGMVVGALLPQMVGATATTIVLALCLMAFGGLLVLFSPRPQTAQQNGHGIHISWFYPFHQSGYGWLFLVFLANGIASAIPATLMPFFVRDALNIADWMGPLLALYLLAGAAAIPLWVRLSKRIGLVRTWLWGMGLSVVTFAWAFLLPGYPGDLALVGFAMVAGLSGIALGADLVAPAALLAGIIHKAGDAAERGGSYFGLWNFGAKLTLALAAGMALPLLDWLGYVPGTGLSQPDGITALAATYCLLPCFLKICAATLLWRARHHLAGD